MMYLICAWCDRTIKVLQPVYDYGKSHGICEKCLEKQLRALEKLQAEQQVPMQLTAAAKAEPPF
jgi:hypothetical protein